MSTLCEEPIDLGMLNSSISQGHVFNLVHSCHGMMREQNENNIDSQYRTQAPIFEVE